MAAAEDSGELETIARALRLRGSDVRALAGAETAELVTFAEGRVRFAHPLLRSAAYHRASAPARRDAHAALAEAHGVAGRGAVRRAWHLAAASVEPDESVASELDVVAMDASERAAPSAAGRAFEAAARLTPEGAARVRRLLEAGRAHHLAGSLERALALLDRALTANENPLIRADLQHLRAQVEGMRGYPADARALLVAEAELVRPHDHARAAVMLLEAALMSCVLGEPREMVRLAELAFPMAEATGEPVALLAALNLGVARILRGDTATGYPLLRRARALVHGSDLSVGGFAATWVLLGELSTGHFEEARLKLADLVASIRAQGALMALPFALQALSLAEYFVGNWLVANAMATEAIALAEEVGQRAVVPQPRVVVALIAGAQGRITEAHDQLERALALAREHGVESVITMAGWVRGQVDVGVGRYDEAIAALEIAGRFSLERGLEEPGVAGWAQELAEAYLRVGRIREAEATLEILEEQARRTGRELAHAGAERCRGLLAGDEDFEAHFRRALAWHERVPCPFERGRTELCFGERLRRARRRSDAREPLRCALAVFEELGARPWADRASAELRATGERARRRAPDTADQLTAQELQVAQLIAEGATNREAAAALFVTPKTIETHLSHVYRKVGVRSRVELSRRLAVGSP
jgi:DNA-binding CsgD family transcriptional regulator